MIGILKYQTNRQLRSTISICSSYRTLLKSGHGISVEITEQRDGIYCNMRNKNGVWFLSEVYSYEQLACFLKGSYNTLQLLKHK